jgi:hypothetical protein
VDLLRVVVAFAAGFAGGFAAALAAAFGGLLDLVVAERFGAFFATVYRPPRPSWLGKRSITRPSGSGGPTSGRIA